MTDNRSNGFGSGIYIFGAAPQLQHTTIARNTGGDGSGIYVTGGGTPALTNTILVNQQVGITVTSGSTATLSGVLGFNNGVNSGGAGTTNATQTYIGNPAFAADGYHLTASSMAINKGVDAGIAADIDGEPRDAAPDLGADEVRTCWARLNVNLTDYGHVQAAVDASTRITDVVKVAGYCPGALTYAGSSQSIYVTKTVTIQGGYTITRWIKPLPAAYPTTLDALGQGRVFYITGNINPTIEGLRITGGNSAQGGGSSGGGIYILTATATITNNWILGNSATDSVSGYGYGGGLYLSYSHAALVGNTISSNSASGPYGGYGGGVYLDNSPAALNGNMIVSNTSSYYGGGLYLSYSSADLINNVVADNRASSGSGLYVYKASPRLRHTTIARNSGGDGSGVYATYDGSSPNSTVMMTNTLLVSQGTGINVTSGNTAVLNGVLWYNNGVNTSGSGAIAVTQAYTGNPAFAADGYHLTVGSMAIDRGIKAGIVTDIDGQSRDAAPDLGADEYRSGPGESRTIVDPNLGGLLIYTDTRGLTTTLEFPPGAVPDATDIVYTAVPSPTEPVSPGLRLAGLAFDLDAYRSGERLFSITFSQTVAVTIHYADADVRGIFEDTLKLYRWVSPIWEEVGTRPGEGQLRPDTDNNVLTAWLRGLSRFGDLGVTRYDIYLPIVIRNG